MYSICLCLLNINFEESKIYAQFLLLVLVVLYLMYPCHVPLPCTLAIHYEIRSIPPLVMKKKKIIFSCVYNSAPRWVAKFNLFHLHIIKKKYSIWYLYWNICKHLILITNFANMSCQMYFLLYKRKKKKKEEQDISTK